MDLTIHSHRCYICNNNTGSFMTFGPMPIANGFLAKDQFENEYFFEMEVAFCNKCKMFQLVNQPDPGQMFNENYAFFSGTSKLMANHFDEFSTHVLSDYIKDSVNPFVVEIGSNDGIMLKHFAQKGIRHLGIEPSANVAQVAIDQGVNTIVEFFDKSLAEKIVSEHGKVDAYIAANVMCHIPYINSIVEGVKVLLKPDGIVMFEDPYLGNVVEKTTYDQIYDEHTFLFSVHSIQYVFNQFDMEVIDVEPQSTHGGSMRYVIAHKGAKTINNNVKKQLEYEIELGLTNIDSFNLFKNNCEKYRTDLLALLSDIKSQGKTIAGYAATSKSTTIINYCGITTNHLDCIYDTTPIKQGKFSPGAHIPIKPHSEFKNNYPDYALLFGYNHEKEIMAKEQEFMDQGGKWITYVPEVKIF
ncbi:MAG: class I SAM-dependent methyltransferase [Candidatus Marinimicrobia bacterium]|jgi:methylation protein EvaC|nr:class I SAM-dependent methyltransferase [Candidatus Neomarinimicrobiota bacterium]